MAFIMIVMMTYTVKLGYFLRCNSWVEAVIDVTG